MLRCCRSQYGKSGRQLEIGGGGGETDSLEPRSAEERKQCQLNVMSLRDHYSYFSVPKSPGMG